MSRRPAHIVRVVGILAALAASVACQAYGGPRVPRAGAPYGSGTSPAPGPVAVTPVAGTPSASPAHSTAPKRGSRSRHVVPRPMPATRVPQVPGHQRERRKVVALTFDDGPGPHTAAVLRVLRRERVPATFFVLGRNVVERPADVRALVAAGMSVQSHTWDHEDLTELDDERVDAELTRTSHAVERAGGVRPTCVRPPFGATDHRVQRRIAHAGQVPVTWNVDTDDWAEPGTKVVVRRALAGARPGAIVLMHDGGGDRAQTVAALPTVIHRLRARGYTFTTLCSHAR